MDDNGEGCENDDDDDGYPNVNDKNDKTDFSGDVNDDGSDCQRDGHSQCSPGTLHL